MREAETEIAEKNREKKEELRKSGKNETEKWEKNPETDRN